MVYLIWKRGIKSLKSTLINIRYSNASWPCFSLIKLDVIKWRLRPRSLHSCNEKCVNTALLVRLSLPSTLIRHEKVAFKLKRRFKPAEELIWKCRLCPRFSVDCRKRSCFDNHVFLLSEFSSHKSKMNADYCVLNFFDTFSEWKLWLQISAPVQWGGDVKPGLTNCQFVHTS